MNQTIILRSSGNNRSVVLIEHKGMAKLYATGVYYNDLTIYSWEVEAQNLPEDDVLHLEDFGEWGDLGEVWEVDSKAGKLEKCVCDLIIFCVLSESFKFSNIAILYEREVGSLTGFQNFMKKVMEVKRRIHFNGLYGNV